MKYLSYLRFVKKNKNYKKYLLILGSIIVCLAAGVYWIYSRFYITTDDAYLNANVVQVASRVTGKISKLNITNNQYVEKNAVLFEIDPNPYKIGIEQGKARVESAKARLKLAQITLERTQLLTKENIKSAQDKDKATEDVHDVMGQLHLAMADVDQASLNLSYTRITAPVSGWVTNVTLREGNNVEQNRPLFALVDAQEFWVDANFKETELEGIIAGQEATIYTDMFPDHPFKGIVDSVSRASGTAFSLLPPQNATGNWVKVTQRVPVKIRVQQPDPNYPLRIGTTVTVKIHVNPWKKKSEGGK